MYNIKMKVAAVVIVLTVHLLHQVDSFKSVLDVPDICKKGFITEDVFLSPKSPQITKKSKARSIVECYLNCLQYSPVCTSVFKDTTDNCYEINGNKSAIDLASGDFTVRGSFVAAMAKGQESSCGGRTCADNEVCRRECENDDDSELSICVADQSGECGLRAEYSNMRHYWSPIISDDRDSGSVMYVTYPKARNDSGIRVIIHMNVRGHCQTSGDCNHWYLTFDGNRCANPQDIEHLDYSANTGNSHRAMDIDGTCYGLDAGDVGIDLVINPCDGFASTNGHSGYASARTMLIIEMIPQAAVTADSLKSCPLLNVFNYKYESWNEEVIETFDLTLGGRLLKAVTYEKMASDTSLHVKYSALTGVIITNSAMYYCGRWYVKINGTECSPQLDFVIWQTSVNRYTYWADHRRGRTAEGICDNNLSAGTYSVEVWVGSCVGVTTSQPTKVISGGFNSPSRLHIEEVRTDYRVDGVRSNNYMYRSHSGNLARTHWWQPNREEDSGDIFSITYVKQYEDTGLRLTSSGDHMSTSGVGYFQCGRWHFKIDGSECTDPGTIEGVSYFNFFTAVHNPMQVSGICQGISAANHTIVYAVASCQGSQVTNARTGRSSSFHIFIEELRVELYKTCSGTPVNCDVA